MFRFLLFLILAGGALFAEDAALSSGAEAKRMSEIVPEEDHEAVLSNPDMGWVLYENYPLDQSAESPTLAALPGENFPEAAAVAIMFSWQDIEHQPDVYDFSKVDFAYDYWRQRGKSIQLRISTETLVWWSSRSPPSGKGIPDYVLASIPAERKQERESDGHHQTYVDAREPFYLERLRKFLEATAAHYSGKRAVSLVDLRGYGKWGEWHSGYRYATDDDRHAALSTIIDVWSAAFPRNWLALSYSYDPDGPKELFAGSTKKFEPQSTSGYEQFLSYSAFDYALTKRNVTLRRDGAGGAVHSNERRLCEQAYQMRSRGPMVCEFLGGFGTVKKAGPDWVTWMIEDALSLHPNYMNLLGWQGQDALDFIHDRPDLISHGARTMGYRLSLTKAAFPSEIRADTPFELKLEWVNRGVGRAMRDFLLRLSLRDSKGKPASQCDIGPLQTSRWLHGEQQSAAHIARFTAINPGSYQLCVMLIDPSSEQPIRLPLKNKVEEGVYSLAKINLR